MDSKESGRTSCGNPIVLILLLFVLTRAMCLLWFSPAYSEFTGYQYDLAALSDQGFYPFVDYWVEYPPLYPWVSVAIYRLASILELALAPRQVYLLLSALLVLASEAGILYLVYNISRRLYGPALAERIAWIYSALFLSFFVTASFFDSIPALALLAAVYCIIWKRKALAAAILIALGFAIKLMPLLLLPLLYKQFKTVRTIVLTLALALLLFLPFIALRPVWIRTFWRVNLARPPWETVWALLAGQHRFGYVGPMPAPSVAKIDLRRTRLQSRFSEDLSYLPAPSMIYRLVYLASGVAFLLIFAYYGWQRLGPDPGTSELFAFAAFSVLLFFLYAKGWSPQFLVYILPFILVGLPEKPWLAIAFNVINFIEMPIWLFWFQDSVELLAVVIIVRTALLAYCAWLFQRRLSPSR